MERSETQEVGFAPDSALLHLGYVATAFPAGRRGVISVETAARQAQRRGHSLREELQILLIHGLLHLLGYDHEISRCEAIRTADSGLPHLPV